MADNRNPGDVFPPNPDDSGGGNSGQNNNEEIELLKSMDATLHQILTNVNNISQSMARGSMPGSGHGNGRWQPNRRGHGDPGNMNDSFGSLSNVMDKFTDGLEEVLMDSLLGSDFKDKIKQSMSTLADQLGVQVGDIPKELGKELGSKIVNSGIGEAVSGKLKGLTDKAMAGLANAYTSASSAAAAGGASAASAALSGLGAAAAAAAPYILIAVGALIVIDKALETLGPAIEGTKVLFEKMKAAGNRYQESQKKGLEEALKRQKADVEAVAQAPFDILKAAAQNLYDAWDSQIRKITATQGYEKADVQSLMSAYAERLRNEGLTSVVSGSDIVNNLSKVLDSGLSGQVAEEFAYLATKLNAAVPTEDFFSYASTYASIAGNAIKDGYAQSEAIAYANAQMESFASNVLYASRQLAGGFSTGLRDAEKLFDYSVQIANASKEGNAAAISGVLTSVSAITGAIAPDLASGIVDAVVNAAIGGNSSEIVALRSLAGINASNTEFLKAIAQDPQAIFTTLFTNLAKMQNMSNDNFMEVAEGLSSVFGISMDAFARVDFNYLANAISSMNVNNASLNENMSLLVSGQTTTTAEQLKMAQINKYMIEEGLAYVLDNEVARQIQQHMWDEQLARELQETTYAVELQGAAMEFLQGIKQTVDNIVNFLNPFSWLKKAASIAYTAAEAAGQKADIAQLLELGKVGQADPKLLYQLTTTNKNLQLVPELVELMGGKSMSGLARDALAMHHKLSSWSDLANNVHPDIISSAVVKGLSKLTKSNKSPDSKYAWASVSKSTSSLLAAISQNSKGVASQGTQPASVQEAVTTKSNSAFEKFLGTIEKVTSLEAIENKTNLSYEEWVKTAKSHGINDYKAALEQYGTTEADIKAKFTEGESKAASEHTSNRQLKEDEFWKQATSFALNTQEPWLNWEKHIIGNQEKVIEGLSEKGKLYEKLTTISTTVSKFLAEWTSYYVNHTAYSKDTMSAYKAADIIKAEKKESGDAVLALAEALTANTIGITQGFKDPVVQTNVLLAKILLVAEQIMQQNNTTGGLSLPDSFAALAAGLIGQAP